MFSLDVTSHRTNDCLIQYNVPALKGGAVHTLQTNVSVDVNWTVVFMELHQHIGGVNMTVEHFRGGRPVVPLDGGGGEYTGGGGKRRGHAVSRAGIGSVGKERKETRHAAVPGAARPAALGRGRVCE